MGNFRACATTQGRWSRIHDDFAWAMAAPATWEDPRGGFLFRPEGHSSRTGLANCKEGTTMLVLTRKCNEQVVIGEGVRITVVAVERHKVRLGIQAPREVPIYREEILAKRSADQHRLVRTA